MNEKTTWRLEELHRALLFPVIVQVTLVVLSALLLDGGFSSRIVIAAVIGHWLLVFWIASRRRNALTKTDTVLIRLGFYLWLPVVFVLRVILGVVAETT